MNAPAWLTVLAAALMLAVAMFFAWRLAVAGTFGRAAQVETDAFYALAGLALAGMLARWMRLLPPGAWAAVFGCAALWFVARAVRAHRARDVSARGRYGSHAALAAVLVYMPLAGVAPSTISGSTAGMVTMAGMPGMIVDSTERSPGLGLLLVLAAVAGAVVLLDRVSAVGGPARDSAGAALDPMDRPGPLPPLLPRIAETCRVLLLVVIAYAILGKLV